MLLPEALCGIASVLLLHNIVRRTLGHRAALLAALMLALTPIFVAMSRFNNPDPLLVLCEIAAARALVRALESGRTRHLLLCGLFIGLAFNVKMLAAYLVVPGLALAFMIAGQGSIRRRVAQLAAGGGAMLAVSFVWYGAMMLIPAAHRPFVGDTTDNSWFSLIFGANGLNRVSGSGGGPTGAGTFGGSPGLTRLFNPIVGGQISWLLPLALFGLLLGLWARRRAPRTDPARSAYILWGGCGVVTWAIFSFSEGVFHPYYTTALAPAVAVLAAGGLVEMWDRARRSIAWAAVLWRRRDRHRRVGGRAARSRQRVRAVAGAHGDRARRARRRRAVARADRVGAAPTPIQPTRAAPLRGHRRIGGRARRPRLLRDRHRRRHAHRQQSARRARERQHGPRGGARRWVRWE